MIFCFALYPFTRGRARTVQVVLAYGILLCIISLHTWSCIHCSSCPSVWYFVCIISLHMWSCTHCSSSPSVLFYFALYPSTRGRARTIQVVLAYGILFCIISLHTWLCTHCSCCPSVWYFVLHYILHTWSCTHCSSCPSLWYFVLHDIPSHVVVHALIKLS
jgi:hypothetical protein